MFIRPKEDWAAAAIVGAIFTILFLSFGVGKAHSAEYDGPIYIDEATAIHAILGEARGEGYRGMYAVACAIRNRGTLHGVYGATADISDVSARVYQLAAKAWALSENGPDVTNGATYWENCQAFGVPYWSKGMECTLKIGRHCFFKENA